MTKQKLTILGVAVVFALIAGLLVQSRDDAKGNPSTSSTEAAAPTTSQTDSAAPSNDESSSAATTDAGDSQTGQTEASQSTSPSPPTGEESDPNDTGQPPGQFSGQSSDPSAGQSPGQLSGGSSQLPPQTRPPLEAADDESRPSANNNSYPPSETPDPNGSSSGATAPDPGTVPAYPGDDPSLNIDPNVPLDDVEDLPPDFSEEDELWYEEGIDDVPYAEPPEADLDAELGTEPPPTNR